MFKIYVRKFNNANFLARKKKGHKIFYRRAHDANVIYKGKKIRFYCGNREY